MGAMMKVADAPSFLASLDQAKFIRDKAEALRVWARARGDADDIQRTAAEMVVRALRRIGELAPPKREASDRGQGCGGNQFPAETDLPRKVLHEARAVASLSSEVFEHNIACATKAGRSITKAEMIQTARLATQSARVAGVEQRAAEDASKLEPGLYGELAGVPSGRYRTIYADPPWHYQDTGCGGAAAPHYETMPEEDLEALDVARLAHPEGCHLWLWTTWPMLREGQPQRLIDAWGFDWKSEVVWHKSGGILVGRWLRKNTEILILAARGSVPLLTTSERDHFETDPGRHSEKPAEARALVERCSPGPRLEMFARLVPASWDAWGDQCERSS